MTIIAAERTANVKASLFNYIDTNYTTTAKDFQGSDTLATTAVAEWVWFGIVGEAPAHFLRHTDNNNLGELYYPLLQCLINVKPSVTILRMDTIRDTLENLLRRASISVLDYAGGGNGLIGKLTGEGTPIAQALGRQNDVEMMSILFRFRFLRQYGPQ